MHSRRLDELSLRLDHTCARTAELADEQVNRANESKIVVHGLPRITLPTRPEVRDLAQKNLVALFAKLFGQVPESLTIVRTSYFDAEKPVYEATMTSDTEAGRLRRLFGKKSFSERRASGVRLVNSVTPSTRVRLSILRTMSQAYKRLHPQGVFQLHEYLPRPLIKIRPESTGPFRTYGFVDAIVTLPPQTLGLNDSDFEPAYKIAGRRFPNSLKELFIVLSDNSPLATEALLPGCPPRVISEARKRANDGSPMGSLPPRRQNLDSMEVDLTAVDE